MSYTAPALTTPVVLSGGYSVPDLSISVVLGADTSGGYTPPALTTPVVLSGGYTAPALTVPVVLGAEIQVVSGTLAMDLPPVIPDLTLAATGIYLIPATLAISLQTPALPLTFIARERTIDLALAIDLPVPDLAFTLTARADFIHAVALAIPLPLPDLTFALTAAATVDLALMEDTGPRWGWRTQAALTTATGLHVSQQPMLPLLTYSRVLATAADPIWVNAALVQTAMLPVRRSLAERHQHGLNIETGATVSSAEMVRTRRGLAERYQHGTQVIAGAAARDAETVKTRTRLTAQQAEALPTANPLPVWQHPALFTATRLRFRWQHADKPAPGRWWPRYEPPGLDVPIVLCQHPYIVRPLRCAVVLHWEYQQQPFCPGIDPDPDATVTVPIQEVYLVINSFSLVRADTGQAVDALDFDATLTADSWAWSWSASIPASQISRVQSPSLTEFVELIATVNGTAIRLLVESWSRSRKFGSATLNISGRGRAAWLAEPHSPIQTVINTESRTAQQLLNDALTVNGVTLGWAVTWQLEDWSVPAGLWSQTGTYIEAANRIAASGGGYIQAHDTDQTLIVKPYYPSAPWDWAAATPDLILPDAVCVTEGMDWQDKPAYNAVWVVGGTSGRRDKVKRLGSAGDRFAPTVVDALATDTVMTRQRGIRVLGDTGRTATIKVSLPILAESGIIKPGKLVRYTEQGITHLGMSRAVSIRCQFPTATQTVSIETHELESV